MTRDRVPQGEQFAAYLAARWPSLVRTVAMLGHPVPTARSIAFEALVAVVGDFPRLHREEDVDVVVHRELLAARERHQRRAGTAVATAPAADPEQGEAADRLEQVLAALGGRAADAREVVVLRQVAELAEHQVADVLGRALGPVPLLPDTDVQLALEAIPVDPLPAGEVEEEARTRRRRVVRRVVGVLTVLALVVAAVVGGQWWLDADRTRPDEVRPGVNPLPMAWYADGRLQLAEVSVAVRPVVDLVTVPGGVVLADDRGQVVMVERDGTRVTLGSTVPGDGLVVEPDNGWVAWADPGEGRPEVVVHDTRIGEEVGRRSLAAPGAAGGQPVGGSGPIAIDGEQVFYSARGEDYVWEPVAGDAFAVSGELADTAGGARLSHAPGGYTLQAAPYLRGNPVPGTDGRLTPDGRYLLVRDARGELVVHASRTGRRIPRLYSPSDRAVGWTYRDGTFWFAVVHKLQDKQYQDMLQMPSEGDYRIFECVRGRADVCIERAEVSQDVPEPPVLAR